MNEGMEALRQIATTSLFLQNEKANDTNQNHRIVPTIREHLDNGNDQMIIFSMISKSTKHFFQLFFQLM